MSFRWAKLQQVEEENLRAERRLREIERATTELRQRVARLEIEAEAFRVKRLRELRRRGIVC